jgi:hypothetical protein
MDGANNMISNLWNKIAGKFKRNGEAKKYSETKPTEKDIATANKEPYVAVLQTHVNPTNVRNGFFELDWNEFFVVQLTQAGYQGDTEEEIVDKWFQDLCRNIAYDEGISTDNRPMGYINVKKMVDGKTEVS